MLIRIYCVSAYVFCITTRLNSHICRQHDSHCDGILQAEFSSCTVVRLDEEVCLSLSLWCFRASVDHWSTGMGGFIKLLKLLLLKLKTQSCCPQIMGQVVKFPALHVGVLGPAHVNASIVGETQLVAHTFIVRVKEQMRSRVKCNVEKCYIKYILVTVQRRAGS